MKCDLRDKDELDVGDTGVGRSVYADRLEDPKPQPWRVRVPARAGAHCLVTVVQALSALGGAFRGRRRPRPRRGARVVLTGTFFADSWIEAHVRPLALASRCRGVDIVADRPFVALPNVRYICPPSWLQRVCGRVGARSLMCAWHCLRTRPEVVGGFHLLCNGMLALVMARLLGARAMYFCVGGWAEFVHGAVHGSNRLFSRIAHPDHWLERRLLSCIGQFDLVLTMGTRARTFMRERGVAVPIEVMSGGIDGSRYRDAGGDKTYDLINVCRVETVKRLDVMLEAIQRVARRVPTVRAVIVGDGSELESLQAMAVRLGIEEHVEFAGRHNDVERWLDASKIFVLTSDSEGLSLALMEAVTAGLPAVVSDVGDLGDLVVNGVNGYSPPPRRPELFAEHICELLLDEQRYAQFSQAAREAGLRYSVEAMRDRWAEILQRWSFPEG